MRICPKCHKQLPDYVAFCPSDGNRLLSVDKPMDKVEAKAVKLDNKVLGSYRLEEVLAVGGMGIVFLAEHIKLGRKVAVKMMRPEYSGNRRAITRFFREARAVNEIKHENIIEISDFIEDELGDNYYIMELLEGQSLNALIAKVRSLPVPRALGIGIQIANALSAVHRSGIVHRDLKTENVFLIKRNENPDFVKLLDFGVAKMIHLVNEEEAEQKTIEGTILGTAEYMSPEQAGGKPVDFRTDIYSLGVILYEILTGVRPIVGNNFSEVIANQITVVPLRPSRLKERAVQLPLHLEQLIMQCLEKNSELRPQSMEEVESRLSHIGRLGSVQLETSPGRLPGLGLTSRRIRTLMIFLLLSGIGLGILVAGTYWFDDPAGQSTPADGASVEAEVLSAVAPTAEKKPKVVHLRFDSDPAGARIFKNGGTEPLGTTPVTLSFARQERNEVFRFSLDRFLPAKRQITLREDGSLRVVLRKKTQAAVTKTVVPRRPKKKRKRSREVDLGGTVDPFAE